MKNPAGAMKPPIDHIPIIVSPIKEIAAIQTRGARFVHAPIPPTMERITPSKTHPAKNTSSSGLGSRRYVPATLTDKIASPLSRRLTLPKEDDRCAETIVYILNSYTNTFWSMDAGAGLGFNA
jgi:hypothetical protein